MVDRTERRRDRFGKESDLVVSVMPRLLINSLWQVTAIVLKEALIYRAGHEHRSLKCVMLRLTFRTRDL